jgi:hypothetical protein
MRHIADRQPLPADRDSTQLVDPVSILLATPDCSGRRRHQSSSRRKRSALLITETELKVMAALAMIGLSRRPDTG